MAISVDPTWTGGGLGRRQIGSADSVTRMPANRIVHPLSRDDSIAPARVPPTIRPTLRSRNSNEIPLDTAGAGTRSLTIESEPGDPIADRAPITNATSAIHAIDACPTTTSKP